MREALAPIMELSALFMLLAFVGRIVVGGFIYAYYGNKAHPGKAQIAEQLASERKKLRRTIGFDLLLCAIWLGFLLFTPGEIGAVSLVNLLLGGAVVLNLVLDIYLHCTIFRPNAEVNPGRLEILSEQDHERKNEL